MHGLVFRSFEGFVRSAYGADVWSACAMACDPTGGGFEAMFGYDDALMDRLVDDCAAALGKPRDALLEDFGTHLVASPQAHRLRRLLRFGGVDYEDFLQSLEDLPGRAQLAVPDIGLPDLDLTDLGGGAFRLDCGRTIPGGGHVVVGLLRALADDYGALVLLDHQGTQNDREVISIHVLKTDFARGRDFDLADRSLPRAGPVP
ncbi:heme NO-binding domain-containing protein [Maritimibacter sp. DP1N21-5]|uniref:heme NO-binding domain-containing protein n=1 Tax=Maritimibacter sp. DP1N21-5 TaxID=2836867 RepID=UPI001C4490E0|nr:heme NO-binding domain-containing protein [Maritimibacter sp. DP1N21-5]MBV7409225.1 heme NO-binding domain-containing protein [Maritimibacter sp. DP1N21-5]